MAETAGEVLLLVIKDEVDLRLGPYTSTADRYNMALILAQNIFALFAYLLGLPELEEFREEGVVLCFQGPPLFVTAEWKLKIHLALMTVEEPW